jgi:FkbM family methyltransferase
MTNMFTDAIGILRQWRDAAAPYPDDEYAAFFDYCLRHIDGARSQLFQELFVLYQTCSKRGGYFVEFGAGDGVFLSNSYMLETRYGWNGIIAEPARAHHKAIRARRNCAIDERCVWVRSNETLVFNQTTIPELSTIEMFSSEDMHSAARTDGERYEVKTVSLVDLLDFHRAPRNIEYLSIDTEGSEFDILSVFDWEAYRFGNITVEHNHTAQRERIYQLLTAKGYVRKFEPISDFDDWYVKL